MKLTIPLYSYCVGVLLFFVDRITKYLALEFLCESSYEYNSFLSFELVINRGISWGMFHSTSTALYFLVSLLIVVLTGILCWHAYVLARRAALIIGHICVIAGSLSNIIDRIWYSGVIDFIVISYHHYSWPVFNIADVAIVAGLIIVLLCNEV